MTICNMTIEGGGRAGMIAPDDTTFEWVEGRPARRRAPTSTRAVERLARRCAPTRAPRSTRRSSSTPPRISPAGHLGHHARAWSRRSPRRSRCPSREDADGRAASAPCATWTSSPARRSRRSRSTASSSARAPTRASATCAPPPSVIEGRTVADASTRWSCPAPQQVKAQAEAEGLDEVFRAAGFDWREAGCSMCLGMNPDILEPGERCASTSNRNFEGRQGRGGRTHLVSPADGRRRGDRGALRRHPRVGGLTPWNRSAPSPAPSACSTAPTSTPTRSSPSSSSSGSSAPASASSCSTTGRKEPGWDLPPNPILVAGPQLRLRLLARARAVGAAGLRLQGDRRAELRRHLLLQLHQDRAAAGRASPRTTCRALASAGRGPRSTSRPSRSASAAARCAFEIDPEIRHRLLNGLDDIALTLAAGGRHRVLRARARAHGPGHHRAVSARPRDWDAATYDRVSTPQQEMAAPVIERPDAARRRDRARRRLRQRRGHRRACSTGSRSGRVIAVDAAPSMVAKAREALAEPRRRP